MLNFFSKKVPEISTNELVELESNMAHSIKEWVLKETDGGKTIKKDSKLAEITIFNFKILFDTSAYSESLREFLFLHKPANESMEDYVISRIHDLYIHLCMIYPSWFIQHKADKLVETIERLNYKVDKRYVDALPYAWLLFELQYCLRYLAVKL